ncbi:MAG: peptidoglycan DD-metalloendopeptidase family protein [Alphaproteobacteria bacterium]|nr:peptidoglycan DD-metalloendopeptidase family protein [Alphaproteobacteria bacterium]
MVKKLIKQIYPTIKSKQYWVTFCSTFAIGLAIILVMFNYTPVEASISPEKTIEQIKNEAIENFEEETVLSDNDTNLDAVEEAKNIQIVEIKSGDTLLKMLTGLGLDYNEANNIFLATKKVFDPRDLRVGQKFEIELSEDGKSVISMRSTLRTSEHLQLSQNEEGKYSAQIIKDELTLELQSAKGKINGTLSIAMNNNGVPKSIVADFINIYSYSIDFRRDVKKGDSYEIIYENYITPEGKIAKYGNIIYAVLNLGKSKIELYRFKDSNGNVDYYDAKGLALKKTLSRRPMQYQSGRISSYFGRRRHPIYKDIRVHWGIDYPAPKGSHIYAAGDGVIQVAQYRSGYGNYIKIRHNSEYSTAYGHMNGFAKGMKPGTRVKQGQIIGYVGSTGRSTGPHLHYEVIKNGKRVNPLTIKASASENLRGQKLAKFKKEVAKINSTYEKMLANKQKEEKIAQSPTTNPSEI